MFQPHKLHLYQRLHQAGLSHSRVSLIYAVSTTILATAMLCGGLMPLSILAFVVCLVGFFLDQFVAVPFALTSKR